MGREVFVTGHGESGHSRLGWYGVVRLGSAWQGSEGRQGKVRCGLKRGAWPVRLGVERWAWFGRHGRVRAVRLGKAGMASSGYVGVVRLGRQGGAG